MSIASAFLPGEWATVADEPTMREGVAKYRNGEEVLAILRPHIGKNVKILSRSFPHIAGVLYELKGIEGEVWEECLVDTFVRPGDKDYGAGSEFYEVGVESDEGEKFVCIRDKQGRLFLKVWEAFPEAEAERIRALAQMRNKGAFEGMIGLCGDWKGGRERVRSGGDFWGA
jgi:hypothetical protein